VKRRHVLVLGDQLNRTVGPLAHADPGETSILMVESTGLAEAMPHHKQKLVLFFSAMRHFAREAEADGFQVDYRRAASFEESISGYAREQKGVTLEVMEPSDWGYEERLREAARAGGGDLLVHPNALWLTDAEEFDGWAADRKTLRLEYFYRAARKRRGWLMDGDAPAGGRWNFDADNREVPEKGQAFPPTPSFPPDALTKKVMREVEETWPEHFGSVDGFAWPVTRADALAALEDFLRHRLVCFGPYEDAMVEGEPVLHHSLLSVPLNLGLLHPLEVCERVLEYAADPANGVPLQSTEGFIRQVLGWREFIRHVYRRMMPELRQANGLEHSEPLPALYWGAKTEMRCLSETVRQLEETGHTHHIQRLMVLGNFALIAGVDPRELNDWFLGSYVDALDWVVTPNVMGMSQFADLGSFTSKPYAASGKYIHRMSDHCARCRFDPKETVGPDACPLNSLYWDFLERHQERLGGNPRMALVMKSWARRDPEAKSEILARAETVRAALRRDAL
jgi:deoxyribodipyrimidine photolyase-related protein